MIKTLFTLVISQRDEQIDFQMQKVIQMPYLVHKDEILEWGKGGLWQLFIVGDIFFNLTSECLTVEIVPVEGTDWHHEQIRLEDRADIQAQLEEDGWALKGPSPIFNHEGD